MSESERELKNENHCSVIGFHTQTPRLHNERFVLRRKDLATPRQVYKAVKS
jgi:hypothetical protein